MKIFDQLEMADRKIVNSYEYAIESITNTLSGKTQTEVMLEVINKYTSNGWRVHTIYSNELGKNALGIAGFGVNSTQSEDIIIFERNVQYNVVCNSEKELLITNYCSELPVRFGIAKMIIPQNADYFQIALAGKYGSGISMEAFRLDAEFITIFDEKISIQNLSFVTQNGEESEFTTTPYEIQLNKNEIRLIKSVKIYVKSYVKDGKAVNVGDMAYEDIDESVLTLSEKDIYGQEYVGSYQETEQGWKCVCGKKNPFGEDICPICGRKRSILMDNSILDVERILGIANQQSNAREIYNALVKYNESIGDGKIKKLIGELQEIADFERFYGKQKGEAIKIIKEFFNVEG